MASTCCCSTCACRTASASTWCATLRARVVDVIAVTSVRDLEVVRRAMDDGVNAYVLKPFTFAAMKAKLEQYAAWRAALGGVRADVVQAEVDRLFELARAAATPSRLPKGLSDETLADVDGPTPRDAPGPLSASTVGDAVGTSASRRAATWNTW